MPPVNQAVLPASPVFRNLLQLININVPQNEQHLNGPLDLSQHQDNRRVQGIVHLVGIQRIEQPNFHQEPQFLGVEPHGLHYNRHQRVPEIPLGIVIFNLILLINY